VKSFSNRCRPPILLLVVVSALLGASLGCQTMGLSQPASQPAPEASGEALNRILAAGVLRVGMTGTQPPLNMKNKRGELVGLDVELAQSLADAMKLELVLVETPFADLLSDLEAGKIDLVISSLTITPARNARVAFAGPYLISGASLLTRDDLVDMLTTQESLDSKDRSWAALTGSTGEALIREAFPQAHFVGIDDQQEAVAQIADGKIDGLIADLPSVRYLLSRNPGRGLAMLPSPFTTEPLGIALPAHSPLFANLVQNYLNTLRYTGELIQMKARWLNDGEWLSEMPEP
jgi:polar amino acid transport system substrate-binding protein